MHGKNMTHGKRTWEAGLPWTWRWTRLNARYLLAQATLTPIRSKNYAEITNEVANGNGYTTGGITLTSVTWSKSGGTTTFDCANIEIEASGGDITFRFAVIYDATGSPQPLVCYTTPDNTPADTTVTDGTKKILTIHASGVLTLS